MSALAVPAHWQVSLIGRMTELGLRSVVVAPVSEMLPIRHIGLPGVSRAQPRHNRACRCGFEEASGWSAARLGRLCPPGNLRHGSPDSCLRYRSSGCRLCRIMAWNRRFDPLTDRDCRPCPACGQARLVSLAKDAGPVLRPARLREPSADGLSGERSVTILNSLDINPSSLNFFNPLFLFVFLLSSYPQISIFRQKGDIKSGSYEW